MTRNHTAAHAAPSREPQSTANESPGTALVPDRDLFMRTPVRELADTLQDVVGLDEAAGFIRVLVQRIGDQINTGSQRELALPVQSGPQVAEVLVISKRRSEGDFRVVGQDDTLIVLENRRCRSGDEVVGRPSMCMMTSNVFGGTAAESPSQIEVDLSQTIAVGAPGCRVVVHLQDTPQSRAAGGGEYQKA